MTGKKTMIVLEWIDASISMENVVLTREEAEQEKLIHGFVCGVLVEEFEDRYVVARDWFDEQDNYRGVASYPKTGVINAIKYNFAKRNVKPVTKKD